MCQCNLKFRTKNVLFYLSFCVIKQFAKLRTTFCTVRANAFTFKFLWQSYLTLTHLSFFCTTHVCMCWDQFHGGQLILLTLHQNSTTLHILRVIDTSACSQKLKPFSFNLESKVWIFRMWLLLDSKIQIEIYEDFTFLHTRPKK